MNAEHTLNVYLTVDTEVWPNVIGWPPRNRLRPHDPILNDRVGVDIYGATPVGSYGLDYQLDMLRSCKLRANYFVEPLASGFFGIEILRTMVGRIVGAGQDVQLHLHTEWLSDIKEADLPPSFRQFLYEFDEDEQTKLIGWGKQALESCGAPPIRAFRAGNFGADAATLRALRRNGIPIDSSYNPLMMGAACKLPVTRIMLQPWRCEGLLEFPVSVFEDYPGHLRHAQVCACSLAEMIHALNLAWRDGWNHFTILFHSFEMIRDRETPENRARPDRTNIRRFEGLCQFLAANADRFRTVGFSEVDPDQVESTAQVSHICTGIYRTAMRVAEQAWQRFA